MFSDTSSERAVILTTLGLAVLGSIAVAGIYERLGAVIAALIPHI